MSKDRSIEEINEQEGQKQTAEKQIINEKSSGQEQVESVEEKDETVKLNEKITKLEDQHLRLYAEFENYKKRTTKERIELYDIANQELMNALLSVLDDFSRALKSIEDTKSEEGVKLIYRKLENTLKNQGLKPMGSAIGKEFDIGTMEAITRIPALTDNQKGKVMDEIERGYYLGNKILRYTKVVVGE